MGKSQRTKGAVFEREIAKVFSDALHHDFKRNIGQARDGGNDIDVGYLKVECKRRKRLATISAWMKQAWLSCRPDQVPAVVVREDSGTPIIMLTLDAFLAIVTNPEKNCGLPGAYPEGAPPA